MKNLEKLKIALIEQIEKMSASEFEELTDVLQDQASGESFWIHQYYFHVTIVESFLETAMRHMTQGFVLRGLSNML